MIKRYSCSRCHGSKDYTGRLPKCCPDCGSKSFRVRYNPKDKLENEFVNITYSENERWSTSMGVPENQVNDFRKRFPNSTYSDDGRLLIKNRPDKLRQMKERGFIEHR